MLPHELSSGDATADRRADYARMFDEAGNPAGAADLMEQALDLAPGWAAGWFVLGTYREKATDGEGAIAAFERVVALDPEDLFGASLKLAALGARAVPDAPSSLYLERMFDDYADRFDHALTSGLSYRVPADLAALLRDTPCLPQTYRLAVDLGCGTGLSGVAFRNVVKRLEGYDLSRNMLSKAAEKGIYDLLAVADLSRPAARSGLFSELDGKGRADLIVATDVAIYLGRLENLFDLLNDMSAPDAVFAFSVEEAGAEHAVRLASSLRYAHSRSYIRDICARSGWVIRNEQPTVIRLERGEPIAGLLFIAQKSP
jgi:predicted TPR repeat methyltransferase